MDWETGFVIGLDVARLRNKPRSSQQSICRSVDLAAWKL